MLVHDPPAQGIERGNTAEVRAARRDGADGCLAAAAGAVRDRQHQVAGKHGDIYCKPVGLADALGVAVHAGGLCPGNWHRQGRWQPE